MTLYYWETLIYTKLMLKLNCDVKLRDTLLNKMMLFIDNGTYKKDDLEKIKYGLEVIYIFITKSLVVFTISYFLGILKYTLLFSLFYSLIRSFACGLHAKKSWVCTLSSAIIFIIIPYLCKILILPTTIKFILSLLAIITIYRYAPADTQKRPIINKKRRKNLKVISTLITLIYIILIFTLKNHVLDNTLLLSIVLESIMISPLTYKIFKLPYNNYKNYIKEGGQANGILS